MFDIGFWELALILILALIVIGPEKLPEVARTVGHWVGRVRKYIEGVKSEVEKEFDVAELKRTLHNQEVQLRELQGKINSPRDMLGLDADKNKLAENKIEPPAEPEYEIIDDHPTSAKNMHANDHLKKSHDNKPETAVPAPDNDKPA